MATASEAPGVRVWQIPSGRRRPSRRRLPSERVNVDYAPDRNRFLGGHTQTVVPRSWPLPAYAAPASSAPRIVHNLCRLWHEFGAL